MANEVPAKKAFDPHAELAQSVSEYLTYQEAGSPDLAPII